MQTLIESTERLSAGLAGLPLLGFRNYWYPLLASRRVGAHPVRVRALGENLVVFRTPDGVAVLVDRCPHRGAQLSLGRTLFPGTLSCAYHGWTFDARGECRGAIVEGPDSPVPGRARVRAYPTEERFGLVWAFIGEGQAPPLTEDLPPQLAQPGIFTRFSIRPWQCNWRFVTENYPDMLHAPFVHRTSLEFLFNRLPAWGRMAVSPLEDGKGLRVQGVGAGLQADYPGLGRFPARSWWRVISRRTRSPGAEVRMPGYIVVDLREPYLGFRIHNVGWPIPVDEHHTRHLNFLVMYPRNPLQRLLLATWYRVYYEPAHRQFVGQDQRILESQDPTSPERLSASDVGLVQWRALAVQLARQRASLVGAD